MKPTDIPAIYIPDILLPRKGTDMSKWAVIACDQYTSEPEYWKKCDEIVGDAPSALRIILPEVKLGNETPEQLQADLDAIAESISDYTANGIWDEPMTGFILTDRSTPLHPSRQGIVLAIDLEQYSYEPGNKMAIRATEGTVLSRIPPRVKIRQNASVELPHVMLLYDDPGNKVIGAAENCPSTLVYDTDLMQNSGHIKGLFIDGNSEGAAKIAKAFGEVTSSDGLLFAVGDGNHSLASAKAHWENVKKTLSGDDLKTHPARFALAEAVNIHDKGLDFEPIHRVIFDMTRERFLELAKEFFKDNGLTEGNGGKQSFTVVSDGEDDLVLSLDNPPHSLSVGSVQQLIDSFNLECDYIHGEDSVRKLSKGNTIGILVPGISKDTFFRTIECDGVFPRKTFSMGEAFEKRFYLEARRIVK